MSTARIGNALRNGANVNATGENGITAILEAAEQGDSRGVEFLVAHGASVNAMLIDGETVLMDAACNCNSGCVKFLIDHGADVTVEDSRGQTALMSAANLAKSTALGSFWIMDQTSTRRTRKAGRRS